MIVNQNVPKVSTGSPQTAAFNAMYSSAIGIDVHSKLMVACFQNGEFGQSSFTEEFKETGSSLQALRILVDWCKSKNPEIIIMESTGIYWRTLYGELETNGFSRDRIVVVNPRIVKPLKGHKTDRGDASNLAKHARMGSFSRSFIPSADIRVLRFLWSSYAQLTHQIRGDKRRLHGLLAGNGCRIASVATDIEGVTAQQLVEVILSGDKGDVLRGKIQKVLDAMKKRRGRKLTATVDAICEAAESRFSPEMLNVARNRVRALKELIARAEAEFQVIHMKVVLGFRDLYERLQTIPSVNEKSAVGIICELGDDLSSFTSIKQFASWTGLAPGNNISAGKSHSSKTTHGNKYLRRTLIEVAQGCANTKNNMSNLTKLYLRISERKGRNKAKVAVAHKLARIIYVIITRHVVYVDNPNDNSLIEHRMRQLKQSIARARSTEGITVVKHSSAGKFWDKLDISVRVSQNK